MPEHILFIPSWFSRTGVDGMFIREHARMTALAGHQVGLIYVERAPVRSSRSIDWWTESEMKFGVLCAWQPPKIPGLIHVWKKQYLNLLRAYIRLYGTPDLIHAHGYVAGFAAEFLSAQLSIPFVLTEHSTNLPAGTVPWYHRRLLRLAYTRSNALIAVSEYLRKAMLPFAGPSKEVYVIPNPVDLSRFTIGSAQSDQDILRILSVGSLDSRKNYQLLLRATALTTQHVQVKIIGSGPRRELLLELARGLGIEDRVSMISPVSDEELLAHLHAADVFISTSTMENFGVAIAEALACGIPVIVTQSGGPEEFVSENAGIIVPADDVQALVMAITEIAESEGKFVAAEIRKTVEVFDFPKVSSRVTKIYHSVLGTNAQ